LSARGARALGHLVRGIGACFGERFASQPDDEYGASVSGERGARIPARGRQLMTGFLLGLLFAAGIGAVWAGLTRSQTAAGDDAIRRFVGTHRRSIPTPRFAALGAAGAVV